MLIVDRGVRHSSSLDSSRRFVGTGKTNELLQLSVVNITSDLSVEVDNETLPNFIQFASRQNWVAIEEIRRALIFRRRGGERFQKVLRTWWAPSYFISPPMAWVADITPPSICADVVTCLGRADRPIHTTLLMEISRDYRHGYFFFLEMVAATIVNLENCSSLGARKASTYIAARKRQMLDMQACQPGVAG